MNPLVPTSGEAAVLALALLVVILWVVAVLSLAKDRHYTPIQRLLWLLVVLAAPMVGSVLWLAVGRRPVVPTEGHRGGRPGRRVRS